MVLKAKLIQNQLFGVSLFQPLVRTTQLPFLSPVIRQAQLNAGSSQTSAFPMGQHHQACCFSLRRGRCWLRAIIGKQAHSSCLPRGASGEQRPALQPWSRAGLMTFKTRLLRSRQCEIEISALCVNSPINGFPFHFRSLCNSCVQTQSATNPLQPRVKSGHDVS